MSVYAVNVYPSSATVDKGDWFIDATAVVSASDSCSSDVRWFSGDESIATVNPNYGYIFGVKPGTVKIYAESVRDHTKWGYITVTVRNVIIRVTGITVNPVELKMNTGETYSLCIVLSPYNADNKKVKWTSSNPTVASVREGTGKITAKSPGTATITVTTDDGGFSASCSVRVYYDTITIKKDGYFNKIIFKKSGKEWRCINADMVFDSNYANDINYIQRSNFNTYKNYDKGETGVYRTYTDEELKILFTLDPYGVANYVERYARTKDGLCGAVQEKDRVFRLLFNRNPMYFYRSDDGSTWLPTDYKSDLSLVVSESETIFGMHPLYDCYTIKQLFEVGISVFSIALTALSFTPPLITLVKVAKGLDVTIKILSFVSSAVKGGFLASSVEEFVESAFADTHLNWALSLVSVYNNLNDIANSWNHGENYYRQLIDYCADKSNYNINAELKSGTTYNLESIRNVLN